ncbi:hypothetical protein PBY51_021546 [Eleginops maclovinus]|uniref:IRF tryptophan pentad repeat domain-containing protein n=1 Tax=Eleginops maclovinus TaxID=56733 RepID=A0AAN8AHG4_ELEMC|nr:hypothetical protein PBY51_021546 [Eleginops maclovinus]
MINEMNLDEDSGLSVSCGNGKLRQWLIDQIDSRLYAGLVWENEEKSIFRIPWKHAGKQDYNRDEDAALFKAWALFKGKYKEGVDKPDPPTWKTRLRCALNKSNDFDELVERSQLDISDPYKVYRIIPEGAKRGMKMSMEETPSHANSHGYVTPYTSMQNQVSGYMVSQERNDWRDYSPPEQQPLPPPHHHGPHAELQYGSSHYPSAFSRAWPGSHTENGFQLSFHTYLSESQLPMYSFDQRNAITDFSLHVSLYYRESMVKEGRVYWEGPMAPYMDKPNKLEKEQPCKLFDTQQFLIELQDFAQYGRHLPRHQVVLCFGDEYPDPQRQRKMITAQVEPVFAKKLVYYYQQNNSHYMRAFDHIQEQNTSLTVDYPS